MFKLEDLYSAYEKCISQFHIDVALNRTRLKEEILDHFQKYKIQEQSDGRHIILLFPEGMRALLQNTCLQSKLKSEAVQMARVAKLIHNAMFQTENKSNLKAIFQLTNCQKDFVPYSLNT